LKQQCDHIQERQRIFIPLFN